jgi:hypothetical protein
VGKHNFCGLYFSVGKLSFGGFLFFCGQIQVQWRFSLLSSARFKKKKTFFISSSFRAYNQRLWQPLPDSKTFFLYPLHFGASTQRVWASPPNEITPF